jgi:hypothetical protein
MQNFMNLAVLIETTLVSFLMALCAAWMGLRALFQLLPGVKLQGAPVRR